MLIAPVGRQRSRGPAHDVCEAGTAAAVGCILGAIESASWAIPLRLTCPQSIRCEWQEPALKRLASAVRFRPWPPHSKRLLPGPVSAWSRNGHIILHRFSCPPRLPRRQRQPQLAGGTNANALARSAASTNASFYPTLSSRSLTLPLRQRAMNRSVTGEGKG